MFTKIKEWFKDLEHDMQSMAEAEAASKRYYPCNLNDIIDAMNTLDLRHKLNKKVLIPYRRRIIHSITILSNGEAMVEQIKFNAAKMPSDREMVSRKSIKTFGDYREIKEYVAEVRKLPKFGD